MMKRLRCGHCGEEKPEIAFSAGGPHGRPHHDNLSYECRDCMSVRSKAIYRKKRGDTLGARKTRAAEISKNPD